MGRRASTRSRVARLAALADASHRRSIGRCGPCARAFRALRQVAAGRTSALTQRRTRRTSTGSPTRGARPHLRRRTNRIRRRSGPRGEQGVARTGRSGARHAALHLAPGARHYASILFPQPSVLTVAHAAQPPARRSAPPLGASRRTYTASSTPAGNGSFSAGAFRRLQINGTMRRSSARSAKSRPAFHGMLFLTGDGRQLADSALIG